MLEEGISREKISDGTGVTGADAGQRWAQTCMLAKAIISFTLKKGALQVWHFALWVSPGILTLARGFLLEWKQLMSFSSPGASLA